MNFGITRIAISDSVNGAGAWRFKDAKAKQPSANRLYRTIFDRLDIPLLPNDAQLCITKDDFEAGYDRYLGIDVVLTFANGQEATLQEKFLTYRASTVTVEYMQNPTTNEQGDWFKMKTDYYFVGYDRLEKNSFQEWILLNWLLVRQMTNQGLIPWEMNKNIRDGARANFKYVNFSKIPAECIVHGKWDGKEYLEGKACDIDELRRIYQQQTLTPLLQLDPKSPAVLARYGEYTPGLKQQATY